MDNGRRSLLIHFVLTGVVKNFLEVKLPHVCLIVDHAKRLVLILFERDGALLQVYINIFASEVGRRSRPDYHLHGLLRGHLCALIKYSLSLFI